MNTLCISVPSFVSPSPLPPCFLSSFSVILTIQLLTFSLIRIRLASYGLLISLRFILLYYVCPCLSVFLSVCLWVYPSVTLKFILNGLYPRVVDTDSNVILLARFLHNTHIYALRQMILHGITRLGRQSEHCHLAVCFGRYHQSAHTGLKIKI